MKLKSWSRWAATPSNGHGGLREETFSAMIWKMWQCQQHADLGNECPRQSREQVQRPWGRSKPVFEGLKEVYEHQVIWGLEARLWRAPWAQMLLPWVYFVPIRKGQSGSVYPIEFKWIPFALTSLSCAFTLRCSMLTFLCLCGPKVNWDLLDGTWSSWSGNN